MVKVLKSAPVKADGSVALRSWAHRLCRNRAHLNADEVLNAAQFLRRRFAGGCLLGGIELAELVASLQMDESSVLAALFCHAQPRRAVDDAEQLQAVIGGAAMKLVQAMDGMRDIDSLDIISSRMLASEAKDQTLNIRRMLVSLIDDGRVAALKLAERVVALRRAKRRSEERRVQLAAQVMTVFVPLADRLGIWQLKWEMEDLSLRYLEPDAYKRIARRLAKRRAEREAQVQGVAANLQAMFKERGIDADVSGRAKHIYSLWRKMRVKSISFNEVYDLQAVRVVVSSISQCYEALGIVHTRWRHVCKEFDDYIATPKENGYRSIHTAVVGDDGKAFEVQIRTREMDDDAELGICAHWSYKGGGQEDEFYADKVARLRQVLEWQEEEGGNLADPADGSQRKARVFVSTPKGQVVDLTAGATPLDFAYRVHTEVGHHCVGARVNGRPAALNAPLATGQTVQVETDPNASPSRAWLDPELGYARTARARNKIRAWFREQEQPDAIRGMPSLDWMKEGSR